MFDWIDVNFKVLVDSEDKEKLIDTINIFLCELNKTISGGVSSPKMESIHINDIMFEKILEKGLKERENK